MEKKFQVLIIEDHPLIANAYELTLKKVLKEENINSEFFFATAIDEAVELINQEKIMEKIDLILLDISLPKGKSENIISGEDIGLLIKKKYPNIKIVIATTFFDSYRVNCLIKNINPDGFLIKNDLNAENLINAFKILIKAPPFYSQTVMKILRKQMSSQTLLDNIDRLLLYELSIGTKMTELPEILPLSKAGIDRRKRNLKIIFNVENGSDRNLLAQAKDQGFI